MNWWGFVAIYRPYVSYISEPKTLSLIIDMNHINEMNIEYERWYTIWFFLFFICYCHFFVAISKIRTSVKVLTVLTDMEGTWKCRFCLYEKSFEFQEKPVMNLILKPKFANNTTKITWKKNRGIISSIIK